MNQEVPSQINLYPHEKNAATSTLARLYQGFVGKPASQDNLLKLGNEAHQRFNEINLKIRTDMSNMEMADDGELYLSPIIEIVGRVNEEEEHDFELHHREVITGEEDGKAGYVDKNNKFRPL